MHTIPIDRCIFLYTFITGDPICFPSLFIQTIDEVYKNNSKKRLFFPVCLGRILEFIELEHFPSSELVHLTTVIGATFLKQRNAQKKTVEPSVVTTKRPRVESTAEDVLVDPIATVVDDDEDDADVDATATTGPSTSFPSLCSILKRVLRGSRHSIS